MHTIAIAEKDPNKRTIVFKRPALRLQPVSPVQSLLDNKPHHGSIPRLDLRRILQVLPQICREPLKAIDAIGPLHSVRLSKPFHIVRPR